MAYYKTFSDIGKTDEVHTEVPQIKTLSERQSMIQNNKIVVVDNYTDWCGPCKHCAPQFAELSEKYGVVGKCVLVKENVDDKCGGTPVPIRGVPCFHFYFKGQFQEGMIVTGGDITAVENNIKQLLAQ